MNPNDPADPAYVPDPRIFAVPIPPPAADRDTPAAVAARDRIYRVITVIARRHSVCRMPVPKSAMLANLMLYREFEQFVAECDAEYNFLRLKGVSSIIPGLRNMTVDEFCECIRVNHTNTFHDERPAADDPAPSDFVRCLPSACCPHTPRCDGHEDDMDAPGSPGAAGGPSTATSSAQVGVDLGAGGDKSVYGVATPTLAVAEILQEILDKRKRQDFLHGGADHDDTLDRSTWLNILSILEKKAWNAQNDRVAYSQFLHIAAVAVAAMESIRRKDSRNAKGGAK